MDKLATKKNTIESSALLQFIVSFVVPIIILTRFSAESSLGPTKSLILALAFPIFFEIYNVRKRKKLSMFSLLAIGGILVTGAISLLGLSEGWLATRRAVPYLAMSIAILVSIRIRHPILNALLPQMLDMDEITSHAQKKHTVVELERSINRTSYMLSGVLLTIAIASYILTRIIIVSETGTTGYNQEYANLRIWSLPIITLPLLVGFTGVILYLTQSIKKLTGLDIDSVLKKKHP